MKYYAGIDLGGTYIKCGIVSADGQLIIKDKIPTGSERPYIEIAEDMAKLVKSLEAKSGVTVEAVGIGSPGTVNSKKGIIVYSNNIEWENVPLGDCIGNMLQIPVFITNDANAAALGESYMGAGKKFNSIVLITLGTGVGGGIVLDGKLYEGGYSAGAELGHTVIRMKGEKCTCGRRGCFEAYASATALINSTKAAMKKNPESLMWHICGGVIDNVDGKTPFDAMQQGDKAAKKVVNEYVRYLGEGITNVCNVFRPDAVLLGGGVCAQGETLLKPLRKYVKRNIFGGVAYAPVKILTATLGNDAGIYGAARLAMCGLNRN
ncbi:MAG: ROK family protein [Clostridia bacterium]|nr:ROK family protein [Clostridia bacterium]